MSKIKIPDSALSLITVAIALLLPLAASFYLIGERVMFNFFAKDAMYYMAIANNFTKYGFPTLDGETVTNGFHPLWQWFEMALFKLSGVSHHNQVYAVFAASVIFVYSAYTIVSYGLLKIWGTWPGLVATLALFPGIYSLCFEPRRHIFGEPGVQYGQSPLSAINGMETPLSLLLWAVFFLSHGYSRYSPSQ